MRHKKKKKGPKRGSATPVKADFFARSVQYHQAGQIDKAAQGYCEILKINPRHSDALHLSGVIYYQEGAYESARAHILKAIQINPRERDYYNNLVVVLNQMGRSDEIIAYCRQALTFFPDFAIAYQHIGNAMMGKGEVAAAVSFYRKALALDSALPLSYNNLAHALNLLERPEEALDCCRKALEIDPLYAQAHNNMACAFNLQGKAQAAIDSCLKALEISPDFPEAYNNMAQASNLLDRPDDAIDCCRKALGLNMQFAEAYNNMAIALKLKDRLEEAVDCWLKAVEIKPDFPEALNNLGFVLSMRGKIEEAVVCYRKAVQITPGFAEAYNNLGAAYTALKRFEEAEKNILKALDLVPQYPEAYNNLGINYNKQERWRKAQDCFEKAIRIDPNHVTAYNNLGAACRKLGKPSAAIDYYRKALDIEPEFTGCHSNLIFALHYDPEVTGTMIKDECMRWERQNVPRIEAPNYNNVSDPGRRLRVGYVSPDFRNHSVTYFLEPVLEAHDHSEVEVFCYAEVRHPDVWTRKFQRHADHWRNTVGISDDSMAEMIRADMIDIIVDCAGHTANNRLLALSRKPAPIQVATLLGHGGANGLKAFDYIITDPFLTPPGYESQFVEKILRLPRSLLPFRPVALWPDVSALPAVDTGHVVFGFFGSPVRISPEISAVWAKIIDAVPGSKLLLKHHLYSMGTVRRNYEQMFLGLGDRIEFEDTPGGWGQNMDAYERVDIMLDGFPVTGGTSTLIPLWMGLPVITLAGNHVGQRLGVSFLNNVGLPEMVAETSALYIEKAINLAGDIDRLAELRRRLRPQMADSPLCDIQGITRETEIAYRSIWQTWCAERND